MKIYGKNVGIRGKLINLIQFTLLAMKLSWDFIQNAL
jgi:hypothetical protein